MEYDWEDQASDKLAELYMDLLLSNEQTHVKTLSDSQLQAEINRLEEILDAA